MCSSQESAVGTLYAGMANLVSWRTVISGRWAKCFELAVQSQEVAVADAALDSHTSYNNGQ